MEPIDTLNNDLDALSSDIKQLEDVLLGQIDNLSSAIPEIYSGYASMVRSLVTSAMQIIKPGQRSANKAAVAAEVAARSIQAYGEYKAAKEHNRLLARYITIKDTLARNNIEKVTNLLPKATSTARTSGRLFKKCSEMSYDITQTDETKMQRVAAIQLKALTMYRTNIYLLELCKYLKNEYGVWLTGKQRSDFDMPDYYLINSMIASELFGDDMLQAYSEAADAERSLTGKQIMLLSDYQMTFMALSEKLCKVNVSKAQPCIRTLIENCGAAQEYDKITEPYKDHIENNPKGIIIFLGLLTVAAISCILIFYFEGTVAAKCMIGIAALAMTIRICSKGIRKTKINYVRHGIDLGQAADRDIETICGKVERPDIDYNERKLLQTTISGFFK